jgi:hypothetical protein
MTEKQQHALSIICNHPGITAKQFGHLFWPNHDGHEKHSNHGRSGSTIGKTIWLMAGSYLGKMRKKGLIRNGRNRYGEKDNGFYVAE